LATKGIVIPNGFAVTSEAYFYFLKATGTGDKIKNILKGLNTNNLKDLAKKGEVVRDEILTAEFPEDLKTAIVDAYARLSKENKKADVSVAVRSSATAEDLPDASFAGQQESYLNIKGEAEILLAVKKCMASLFTDRAISYRVDKGFDHFKIGLSVGVQLMVRSDLACSGVMFSIHTESGFKEAVVINASYGLGEYIVKGVVTPDEYLVFKPTMKKGFMSIIGKVAGAKERKLIYATGGNVVTKDAEVSAEDRKKFVLNDKEIIQLAKWACVIEDHYKRPMDMEWAKDGESGKLFIVQARPETVESRVNPDVIEEYILKAKGKVLAEGAAVGRKIGSGKVRIIKDIAHAGDFQVGQVLVTTMTDPDWEPLMKKASAIVTDAGGRTCHAAIVSRELGLACVVGTGNGTTAIKDNQIITVSAAEGEIGRVYDGKIEFTVKKTNIKNLRRPKKTKIMMNVGDPEAAFTESFIPNDGVGLARQEFIIANFIKIHPMALVNFDKLKDAEVKKQILELTAGYKDKKQFYIDKLAYGIGRIGAAFYPKDVIVRLSDFKTNEYANLLGGKDFEPAEDNPMIGWRGASRYYDPAYLPAFKMECAALLKARKEMGLKNIKIMVPFCRTIAEGEKVLKVMNDCGLKRGQDGLEVYMMCEIPSNVILADKFCKLFDGFSIGSNDLTQLVLGVDRDSRLVSHLYDENNEAVKILLKQVIKTAKLHKTKVGICGQAPSDFPDFAKFLVKEGIDSLSLIPDTVIKTTLAITKMR
jgi:pyruvate,water dikinase